MTYLYYTVYYYKYVEMHLIMLNWYKEYQLLINLNFHFRKPTDEMDRSLVGYYISGQPRRNQISEHTAKHSLSCRIVMFY